MGIRRLRTLAYALCAFALLVVLTACANNPSLVRHSFSFHAASESPDVEVLDFQYGDGKQAGTQTSSIERQMGVSPGTDTYSFMPYGGTLYVKWRIKATGAVYEDTVDLRARLPRDITDHRIHFVVKGPQLYVYLITPKKRTAADPQGPLRMYSDLVVYTIYPDPTPPNRFN